MIAYDNTPRIGWGMFSLSDSHPFYRAALVHDAGYSDLISGTSRKTLKQLDRELLGNMLRIAASEGWKKKDVGEAAKLAREAWIFYRIVRCWAKYVRPELEEYRPKQKRIGI